MVTSLLGPPCKMGVTLVYMTRMWLGIKVVMQVNVFANEGVHNMPLWQRDYFELKAFENQQMQEEAFSAPPLTASKRVLLKELN